MTPRRLLVVVTALAVVTLGVLVATSGGPHRRRPPPGKNSLPPLVPPVSVPTAPVPALPVLAPAGPAALPAPNGERFGVNVNGLFNVRTYSKQAIDAQLRALRQTGATIARSDTMWQAIEPNPPVDGSHRYDWAFDDEIAGALAANGLRWFALVDYSAVWDSADPTRSASPPRSVADYAAFAGALSARYGASGSFWHAHPELPRLPVDTYEIWNEPDSALFWPPATDVTAYDQLYASARDAIRTADPAARVIVGGLTAPATFLPAMLSARPDLRGHIDGVGIHPYGPSVAGVLARVQGTRLTLNSLGLGSVPLYVTEVGWATEPPSAMDWLPPQRRPGAIAATVADLGRVDCGVAATLLYTWVTPERNPTDREDWFGINRPRGGSSPDVDAFRLGLRNALAAGARIRLCAGA